jgi:hypothetical protein
LWRVSFVVGSICRVLERGCLCVGWEWFGRQVGAVYHLFRGFVVWEGLRVWCGGRVVGSFVGFGHVWALGVLVVGVVMLVACSACVVVFVSL